MQYDKFWVYNNNAHNPTTKHKQHKKETIYYIHILYMHAYVYKQIHTHLKNNNKWL